MSDQKMKIQVTCPHCNWEQDVHVPMYGGWANVSIPEGIEVVSCGYDDEGCGEQFAVHFASEFQMLNGKSILTATADVLVFAKPAAVESHGDLTINLHGESNAHTA